ncbi:hypothetical protein OPT61_g9959 [Boeremia exigua]|uniref:Uncharacterized protein n=1 Tax=Boeremia exigua TaxID=749465 RepID=A0ACC2HS20_9PLEO|nr:hypothetical protein OPT61_g9959 [Boeremia exigua]
MAPSNRYSWNDDFTISREHLRIHCILYEENPVASIAPFVYATDLSANGTYLKKRNVDCAGSQGRGIFMGKTGSFLLDDGDELQMSENVTLIYRSPGEVKQSILTATQKREKAILSSRYLITDRLLGEGGYGKVLIGVDQTTQRQLACKMVNLTRLYDRRADMFMTANNVFQDSREAIKALPPNVHGCFREFDILKDLNHPNIVHIQKVFWSRSTIYMFQELVTGGDLFSYIQYKHGKIPSIESAVIIRQVLKGVQYLHENDIVHRDLKPDNILMTSLDSGARVVITDFGHARFLPDANSQHNIASNTLRRMFSIVGTLDYAAPEIHRANGAIPRDCGYSLSVDMWSIGSITAAILTGELLFSCRQDGRFEEDAQRVVLRLAAQCDLRILDDKYHPLWGPIASAPKDFIKRLLVLDEVNRMSAREALDHIWFTHPMMAKEFDAQYERSIKGWRPRHQDEQLIEQISALETTLASQRVPGRDSDDDTRSRFYSPERVHTDGSPPKEHHHADDMLSDYQLECQPDSSRYYKGCTANAQTFEYTDDQAQIDRTQSVSLTWNNNEDETHTEYMSNERPMPCTNKYEDVGKTFAGQLHRVSTPTRGRYFKREITDLDKLNASRDQSNEDMDIVESIPKNADWGHQHISFGREETIQVRTTPFADDEACGGVEQWWHHRYPSTQYHYNTQAEPITQDQDDDVVYETPPEILKQKTITVSREHCAPEQNRSRQSNHKTSLTHRIGKQKRVYGRQR